MLYVRAAIAATVLLSAQCAYAQPGCTDPQATNYNPSATSNDGSCVYAVTHKSPVLRGALNPIITESSGIVITDGKMWTHNDSGNPPDFYSIDTSNGHTLQTVTVDNYPNVDWEDITADSAYIYLGDHGNNSGDRTDLKVLKIAKADIGTGSTVHVNAQAINFSYTDQTSFVSSSTHNFDCEALMSIRDSLYIFTKDRGDHQTRVYKMPKTPGTYALTPYTSYNAGGLITGADYNAATNQVVLVGYEPGHTYSFLWFLGDYQGDMFFSGNKRRIEISNGKEWQTEAVCWGTGNRVFVSCETTDSIPASLFITDDNFGPLGISRVAASHFDVWPNPAQNVIYINNPGPVATYDVIDVTGRIVISGPISSGRQAVDLGGSAPGSYLINLSSPAGQATERVEKR